MTDIKPIETRYKGHRFRSRLEARWAVFFDSIGIEWEYEPEGFSMPDGEYYLPDFYIEDWNTWIEIKPKHYIDYDEYRKMLSFSKWKKDRFYIICGVPFVDCKPYTNPVKIKYNMIPIVEGEINSTHEIVRELDTVFFWDFDIGTNIRCIAEGRHGNKFEITLYDRLSSGELQWVGNYPLDLLHVDHEKSPCFGELILEAYKKAMSARFEFGEEG